MEKLAGLRQFSSRGAPYHSRDRHSSAALVSISSTATQEVSKKRSKTAPGPPTPPMPPTICHLLPFSLPLISLTSKQVEEMGCFPVRVLKAHLLKATTMKQTCHHYLYSFQWRKPSRLNAFQWRLRGPVQGAATEISHSNKENLSLSRPCPRKGPSEVSASSDTHMSLGPSHLLTQ